MLWASLVTGVFPERRGRCRGFQRADSDDDACQRALEARDGAVHARLSTDPPIRSIGPQGKQDEALGKAPGGLPLRADPVNAAPARLPGPRLS